ncbi:PH domain-containing protein, partial [Candidatus Hodarchaeum mangrovi]
FYPEITFGLKIILTYITIMILITMGIGLLIGFIGYTSQFDTDMEFINWWNSDGIYLAQIYFFIMFLTIVIALFVSIYYTMTIEYQITNSEVIVKKGVLNKTVKHIPFRTITNVSSRYGPFDRIFRLGTCEIETAGKSGQQTGPEAKIEGIKNFLTIRDEILEEIRKFKGQYTTTTELDTQEKPVLEENFLKAILVELKEIKEVLSK